MSEQRTAMWNAVAPTYAEDAHQWSAYCEEALRVLPVGPADRVLDVACGPGTLAFLAARSAAEVDAVDYAPGMIEQVVAKAARDRVGVRGAVMDAQALAFPDATFTRAFCMFGFFFFPDRPRAFAELVRVLRPGGRVLIGTWAPIERRPFMQIAFEAAAEALPEMPRPGKGDLQTPEECIAELTAAGFTGVSARSFTAKMRVESPEHYLHMIARSAAPLAALKQQVAPAAWDAMMARYLEALERRIPAAGTELAAEALLTTGTR